jgi:hypothetical protein
MQNTYHFVQNVHAPLKVLVILMDFKIFHLDTWVKDKRYEIDVSVIHILVPLVEVVEAMVKAICDRGILRKLCHSLPLLLHEFKHWECMEKGWVSCREECLASQGQFLCADK